MSNWQDLEIYNKVVDILKNIKPHDKVHHLNMPFLSPYQIAIKFVEQFPHEFSMLKMPIGGKNTGQHNSFAQYIAGQLSRIVKESLETGCTIDIEGAFLLRDNLQTLIYKHSENEIESSLGTTWDMSIFRYKPKN